MVKENCFKMVNGVDEVINTRNISMGFIENNKALLRYLFWQYSFIDGM